jgi:oligopeptide transport system substrate-binding protein
MVFSRETRKSRFGPLKFGGPFRLLILILLLSLVSCSEFERPQPDIFYSETPPPPIQEFRWSNGGKPKSFDPARAASPPETDLVRAMFEGLTKLEPVTLEALPAAAERWESSEDHKEWTFFMREGLVWSNGDEVTAEDMVSSWERAYSMKADAPHSDLMNNFVGFDRSTEEQVKQSEPEKELPVENMLAPKMGQLATKKNELSATPPKAEEGEPARSDRGIEAVDKRTVRILLKQSDRDLPKLLAHPVFRPLYKKNREAEALNETEGLITNGPFRPVAGEGDEIVLERSDLYWNKENVKLDRIKFVPAESAEKALDAYKAGEVDAVSNADFAPLALKLLEPYNDFRRTTYAALNFYEVNLRKAPFNDRRVREALAISLERERITEGELGGTARPALTYLPFGSTTRDELVQDSIKARELLEDAGFPEGEGFPTIRLVINRNDIQQRVARAVSRMWKENLNIETEIIVRESGEMEEIRQSGDFDVIRRNIVLRTSDEITNIRAIFDGLLDRSDEPEHLSSDRSGYLGRPEIELKDLLVPTPLPADGSIAVLPEKMETEPIVTQDEALFELRAIPLYFPISYSLVKPYVAGFELNPLDVPNLTNVHINGNWRRDVNSASSK